MQARGACVHVPSVGVCCPVLLTRQGSGLCMQHAACTKFLLANVCMFTYVCCGENAMLGTGGHQTVLDARVQHPALACVVLSPLQHQPTASFIFHGNLWGLGFVLSCQVLRLAGLLVGCGFRRGGTPSCDGGHVAGAPCCAALSYRPHAFV